MGRLIRLKDIATMEKRDGSQNFYHYDHERSTTIYGDIAKGTTTPKVVSEQVLNRFDTQNDWSGMQILVGGEAEETDFDLT